MSIKKVYIAVGFCSDADGEESYYPQVGGNSSSTEFQIVYWRCVVTHFASSIRHNLNANHILFTNLRHIPNIGKFKTEAFLVEMGVEIIRLPFTYQPPKGYFDAWRSTFYKFDMIKYFSTICEDNDNCIILDSDCIWIDSSTKIVSSIEEYGILTYELNYPSNGMMSGLNILEIKKIHEELDGEELDEVPKYFGAEIIAANGKEIKKVLLEVNLIWEISLKRSANGQLKFNTEEHMLSYIYKKLGYVAGSANPYIKRIWTQITEYNNACNEDLALSIWHLPAEKLHGIRRLFTQECELKSAFWNLPLGKEFAQYVGSYVGIPRASTLKIVIDSLSGKITKIKRKISKMRTSSSFINLFIPK